MTIGPNIIHFKDLGDQRGCLVAIENLRQIPFEIKRVYYIYGTRHGVVRGLHAHRKLRQVLICVKGSLDIYCEYANERKLFRLDKPTMGLDIGGLVWHDMRNLSEDCVLLVLANDFYNEADYIRDYQEFLGEKEGMIHAEEGIQRRSPSYSKH